MLAAMRAAGVRRVVWVTLRASRPSYRTIDARIGAAAAQERDVVVADWNGRSAGHAWFADDVHLTPTGAVALAGLLHERVTEALAQAGVPSGEPPVHAATAVTLPAPLTGLAGGGRTLWAATGDALRPLDARTGESRGSAAALGVGEVLESDGRAAWVRPAGGALLPAGRAGAAGVTPPGPDALIARAGGAVWVAAGCTPGTACTGGVLQRLRPPPAGAAIALSARPLGLAGDGRDLWVATGGRRARLERRDARTGGLGSVRASPGRRGRSRSPVARRGWSPPAAASCASPARARRGRSEPAWRRSPATRPGACGLSPPARAWCCDSTRRPGRPSCAAGSPGRCRRAARCSRPPATGCGPAPAVGGCSRT